MRFFGILHSRKQRNMLINDGGLCTHSPSTRPHKTSWQSYVNNPCEHTFWSWNVFANYFFEGLSALIRGTPCQRIILSIIARIVHNGRSDTWSCMPGHLKSRSTSRNEVKTLHHVVHDVGPGTEGRVFLVASATPMTWHKWPSTWEVLSFLTT